MLGLAEAKLAALEPERSRARERLARAQEQALRAAPARERPPEPPTRDPPPQRQQSLDRGV
jgi:hypothetical protein